jgi:hypothetical protein
MTVDNNMATNWLENTTSWRRRGNKIATLTAVPKSPNGWVLTSKNQPCSMANVWIKMGQHIQKNSWFPKTSILKPVNPLQFGERTGSLRSVIHDDPLLLCYFPHDWPTSLFLIAIIGAKKTLQLMRLLLQQKSLCNNVDHYDGRWFLVLVVDQNGIWALSKLQSFWLVRASLLISGQFPTGKNLLPLKSHTTQTKLCFSAESFFLHTHIQPYGGYPNKWGEWA